MSNTFNTPIISCVVCTYRRTDMLLLAIRSLLSQSLPMDEYEIIVVDNNSGDKTEEVVRSYINAGHGNIKYVMEPQQGLSHARNRGIQEAHGEYIAFIDDDAEASPQWLETLLKGFAEHPNAWAIGGKVLPIWDAQRPQWFPDELLPHLSLVDWGEEELSLDKFQHPAGVNCSFRRRVFDYVGLFPTDLGRMGDNLVAGEEAEVIRNIHNKGGSVYYLPQALVYHHIPLARLEKRYFRARLFWSGWSQAIYDRRTTMPLKYLKQSIYWTTLYFPKLLLNAMIHTEKNDIGAAIFYLEVEFRFTLGYIVGFFHKQGISANT